MDRPFKLKTAALGPLVMAALALASSTSDAKLFTISNRNYGTNPGGLVQPVVDQMFDTLETEVNGKVPPIDPDKFGQDISRAHAASGGAIQKDYSTDFDIFLVNVGIGAGLKLADGTSLDFASMLKNLDQLPAVATSAAVTVGIRPSLFYSDPIWIIDPERIKAYLSFFLFDLNVSPVAFNMFTLGANAQYKIIDKLSIGFGALKWGGIELSSGINFASMGLSIKPPSISAETGSFDVPSLNSKLTSKFTGDVEIKANSRYLIIPLEASTSARLLWSLSFYTGLGADIAIPVVTKATPEVDGSGIITASATGTGASAVGTISGDAKFNIGGSGSAASFLPKGFAGFQLDMGVLGLYVHANKNVLTSDAFGVNAGIKGYW